MPAKERVTAEPSDEELCGAPIKGILILRQRWAWRAIPSPGLSESGVKVKFWKIKDPTSLPSLSIIDPAGSILLCACSIG